MGNEPVLGSRLRAFGLVLQGKLPETRWQQFLYEVALAIGMSAVGEPAVWSYPIEGKGGTGQTFCLPITESFLVLDTWSDHDGAYLLVCSCRPFEPWKIETVAACFGLKWSHDEDGRFRADLRLN